MPNKKFKYKLVCAYQIDIFKLVINSLTVHYHGREVALITYKINGVEKALTNGMTCVTLYFY